MTIDSIRQQMAAAAEDGDAPPVRISSVDVYHAGLRRRRVRRWLSGGAAALAVVVVTAGAAVVIQPDQPADVTVVADEPAAAPPDDGTVVAPPSKRTCQQLANAVATPLRAALPADIKWKKPRGAGPGWEKDQKCGGGILFEVSFTRRGKSYKLGFEGGRMDSVEPGCPADRKPVRCEAIPGGEIGHLDGRDEFGVLFSKEKVHFFVGLQVRGAQPLTTAQLAAAARRVAEKVTF